MAAKLTMPSKTLYQGMVYTNAASTDIRVLFEAIRSQVKKEKKKPALRVAGSEKC